MPEPRANQKAERAYVMERDNHRCYACGRMFHVKPEQLQLDHVRPVAAGGADHRGNYGLLCLRCHRAKTNAERRAADRVGRPLLARVFWTVVGLGMVGYAADRWRPWPWQTVVGWLAVGSPLLLAGWLAAVHVARRRRMVDRLSVALQPLTHAPRGRHRVRASGWRGWLYPSPARLSVPVSVAMLRTSDPQVLAGICAEASRVTGRSYGLRRINLNRERLTLADGAPPPAGHQPPAPAKEESKVTPDRLTAALQDMIPGGVTVHHLSAAYIRVECPPGFRLDREHEQADVVRVVSAHMGARFAGAFDIPKGVIDLRRRPPMPSRIDRPRPDLQAASAQGALPFGIDESGTELAWFPDIAAHALIAGRTGSGKTVTLRCLIAGALERGWDVRLVDPKQLAFYGYRGMVNRVATTVPEMVDCVSVVANEMRLRYDHLKRHPGDTAQYAPLLLVIDEVKEFIRVVNEEHRTRTNRTSGDHPVLAHWRSIAALGREARVHLAVGIQRPDAKEFGGDNRDNYGFRAACGPVTQDGARMMFGDPLPGRDVPAGIPGRMTVDCGDGRGPVEAQAYWEPHPRYHP